MARLIAPTVCGDPDETCKHETLWTWRVEWCPRCTQEHLFGGGHRSQDPRALLGTRLAPCSTEATTTHLTLTHDETHTKRVHGQWRASRAAAVAARIVSER